MLVHAKWAFTWVPENDGPSCVTDAGILISDGRFVEIGPISDMRRAHPDAQVLGDGSAAVLPGLINAHHHSNAISHIQHGIEDDVLEPWILGNMRMRSMDPGLRTMVAAGRLLRSGVTAVVDMASVSETDTRGHDDLMARLTAYEASGIRGHLAGGVSFYSKLVHREDDAFLKTLPAALANRAKARLVDTNKGSEDGYLEMMQSLIDHACDLERAKVWYGPPGPQWVGDDLLVKIADAAEQNDVGVQTHVQESLYERLEAERTFGHSMTRHLSELGVLSPRMSFAHAVWSTVEDIETLAATGAAVAHNPSSNLRLRSGVAPLNAMREAGVTVGLGMDGTTLGDDEDMFTEIRLAHRLHRTTKIGGPAPSLTDSFALSTASGATLLRQETRLGRIAPGYQADLVMVKLDRIAWPYIAPEADPLAVVLQRAKQGDVDTVLIDGEVVLRDGLPTRFDWVAAAETLAEQVAKTDVDEELVTLYEELVPHIEDWYGRWAIPPLDPWHPAKSRI